MRLPAWLPLGVVFSFALITTTSASTQSTPAPARPAQRPATPAAPKAATPPTSPGMTNADVIKMVKAGLGEPLIVGAIRQAEKRSFSLNADGLIDLKTNGVSDNIIAVMLNPAATPEPQPVPKPVAAAPAATTAVSSALAAEAPPVVSEIGVYYKHDGVWTSLPPEVVNWKTGGVLKNLATAGLVKGDVNGMINAPTSKTMVAQPLEILVYTSDGVAVEEYQLLRLRPNKDTREFRTVTGGILHVSGGATRDLVPFESKKLGTRTYQLVLPNLTVGEYGILAPGAALSSSASAQLGKIYTFRVQ